jgi:hypothetical protein
MPFTKASADARIVTGRRGRRTMSAFVFALLIIPGCRQPGPPHRAEQISGWHRIATFSGRGNAQLETFPIDGWTWRVQWETRNESPPGTGTFKATAHSGDSGRQLAEIADVRGVDRDTTYVTELPHRYYLVVKSANVDWTMVVEEAVLE